MLQNEAWVAVFLGTLLIMVQTVKFSAFGAVNPLSASIFTDFGLRLLKGSVTQGSMGRDPPRYPP